MPADVAELVDALDLGSSVFGVRVRVSPSASNIFLATKLACSSNISSLGDRISDSFMGLQWELLLRFLVAALLATLENLINVAQLDIVVS